MPPHPASWKFECRQIPTAQTRGSLELSTENREQTGSSSASCTCVCKGAHTCHSTCVRRSEGNLQELILFLLKISGLELRASLGLPSKPSFSLSHLASSKPPLSFIKICSSRNVIAPARGSSGFIYDLLSFTSFVLGSRVSRFQKN